VGHDVTESYVKQFDANGALVWDVNMNGQDGFHTIQAYGGYYYVTRGSLAYNNHKLNRWEYDGDYDSAYDTEVAALGNSMNALWFFEAEAPATSGYITAVGELDVNAGGDLTVGSESVFYLHDAEVEKIALEDLIVDAAEVGVDSGAEPNFLGDSNDTGVLRSSDPLSYTDGGDYITLGLDVNSAYFSTDSAGQLDFNETPTLSELTLTTDLALAHGGTGASLSDPGYDRILFWDETANAVTWLNVGDNLSLSGTNLSLDFAISGVTCDDDWLPDVDNYYDLGSSNYAWLDVYLQGNLDNGLGHYFSVADGALAVTHSLIAGGDSVHVSTTENTNWDAAYTHVSNNGTDHSYIDQDLQTSASPTFAAVTATGDVNATDLIATNNIEAANDLTVNAFLYVPGNRIYRAPGDNTGIMFDSGNFYFMAAGGATCYSANDKGGMRFEVNHLSTLCNFKVQSDNDEYNIFSDGTNDEVGIGTGTPAVKFDVVGASRFGDSITNYYAGSATGDMSFAGSAGFYPRRISQSAAPAAGTGATQIDTGELVIWQDTDDDKVYLVFNDPNAATGIKSVELAL
jgi:hypothetical protein